MSTGEEPFWAIVELMGHRRRAGLVQEVERFGAKLLRIDSPAGEEMVTEFYGGGAIYALRPSTEEVARAASDQLGDVRPVMPVRFRVSGPDPDRYDDGGLDDQDLDDGF